MLTGILYRGNGEKLFPRISQADHVQNFLTEIGDMIFQIVGACVSQFRRNFFQLPACWDYLKNGLNGNIRELIDYRLRICLRFAWLPVVQNCPADLAAGILPALSEILNLIYERLAANWDQIGKRMDAGDSVDDCGNIQEIYFDQVTRMLTREFIEFIFEFLFPPQKNRKQIEGQELADEILEEQNENQNEDQTNGDAKMRDGVGTEAEQVPQLTALGDRVMDEPDCSNTITRTIFMCMQWRDTVALPKALRLVRPVLVKVKLCDVGRRGCF